MRDDGGRGNANTGDDGTRTKARRLDRIEGEIGGMTAEDL